MPAQTLVSNELWGVQAMFLLAPGNPAFTLTNAVAVPAPATVWTLGFSLGATVMKVVQRKPCGGSAGSERRA
jgi:hypothetical protein